MSSAFLVFRSRMRILVLLFAATTVFAQNTVVNHDPSITFTPHVDGVAEISIIQPVTFTIPVADGITITDKAGVWSCIQYPSVSLPAGMTFANGLFTVPAISTASLTLTGGTTYADDLYLTQITRSKITYVKYTAPSTTTASAIKFATVSIPASPKPIAAGAAYDFPYTPPSGHVIGVESNKDPGTWIVEHYAGAIRLRNMTTTTPTAVSPALQVTVAYQ